MYTHNCCCIKVLRNKPDASDSITVLNLIAAHFVDRSSKKKKVLHSFLTDFFQNIYNTPFDSREFISRVNLKQLAGAVSVNAANCIL